MKRRIEQKMVSLGQDSIQKSLETIRQQKFKLKNANLGTLNTLIDEYLDQGDWHKKVDISPLLLVYDELAANTKITLPCKSILELDQTHFRQALSKLKKAHKIELRWVRAESMRAAQEYVNRKNYEISQTLTKEVRDLFRQYIDVREKAVFFKDETEKLTERLVGYENRISELSNAV